MHDNTELINSFLAELENRGVSKNTITAYKDRLTRLAGFLGDTPLPDITRRDVQNFITHLRESGLVASSVAAYVAAMRSFGTWLEAELWDERWRNVFRTIRYPRIPQSIPQTVSEADVGRMIDNMPAQTQTHRRNRAMVSLLYDSGLRVSELAKLTIHDIDLGAGIVRVHNGKGAKERYSFFGPRTKQLLEEWLEERQSFKSNNDALFIGRGSSGLSRQQIENIVRQAGKRVGIKTTPHTLRRSRATHLRNAGVPVDVISLMLGHSSPDVTEAHYLAEDPVKIREILFASTGG